MSPTNLYHVIQIIFMVAAPPPILGGDLKISNQNNWGGPEQKIKFGEELNLRGAYEPQ